MAAEVSHEMISKITDSILPEVESWRNRLLEKCNPSYIVVSKQAEDILREENHSLFMYRSLKRA